MIEVFLTLNKWFCTLEVIVKCLSLLSSNLQAAYWNSRKTQFDSKWAKWNWLPQYFRLNSRTSSYIICNRNIYCWGNAEVLHLIIIITVIVFQFCPCYSTSYWRVLVWNVLINEQFHRIVKERSVGWIVVLSSKQTSSFNFNTF